MDHRPKTTAEQIRYWFALGMIAATALKLGQYEKYDQIVREYLSATRS